MNVSIFTQLGWALQMTAVLRSGSTENIHYVTLSAASLDLVPEGMGALRVALDGVECLAVSPIGPCDGGRGIEFLVVTPSATRASAGA